MGQGKQSVPAVSSPTTTSTVSQSQGQNQRQNQLGNAAVQQTQPPPASTTCDSSAIHLPNPVPPNGDLGYYSARNGDFTTRYADCGLSAPNYYLNYGQKYVGRFTNETAPHLTPEGQAWLGRARINLQQAIEGRRAADPADFDRLEKNDAAFTSFAYGTHADAYWNAGLGELNLFDLAQIGLTPDMRDLLAYDGLTQVADIGSRLMGNWGESAIDYVAGEGSTQELVDAAYQGFSVVGEGIDEAFGEGTTDNLLQGAQNLGQSAEELAHGAYDVAADVVSDGVGAVDSVMGENWTENTADSVRQTIGDNVDTVENGYNTAVEWASDVYDDIF